LDSCNRRSPAALENSISGGGGITGEQDALEHSSQEQELNSTVNKKFPSLINFYTNAFLKNLITFK
jgi:hypothetical protein